MIAKEDDDLWFIFVNGTIAKILHHEWFVVKNTTTNEHASSDYSSIMDYPYLLYGI